MQRGLLRGSDRCECGERAGRGGVVGVIGALLGSQDMHHACSGVWLALTARPRTTAREDL